MLQINNIFNQKGQSTKAEDTKKTQCLAFQVGKDLYCVDILNVKEIRSYSTVTPVPDSEEYLLGILNIRGEALPVYDVKHRFGYGKTEISQGSVIIIVSIKDKNIGLLVDSVSDIVSFEESEIDETSAAKASLNSQFLKGVAFQNQKSYIILCIETIFKI